MHFKTENIKNRLNGENRIPAKQLEDDTKGSNEENQIKVQENGSAMKEIADEHSNSIITKNHHNLQTSNKHRNAESVSNTFRSNHRHNTKKGSMVRMSCFILIFDIAILIIQ